MKKLAKSENKLGIKKSLMTLSGVIALFLFFLIVGVYFVFFNKIFYNISFKKYDVQSDLGVSSSDLKILRNGIIAYFMLFRVSLQSRVSIDGVEQDFYTTDELSHMADVRNFFVVFLFVIIIAALVFALALRTFLKSHEKKKYYKTLGLQLIILPSVFFILLVVLAIFILADWKNVFELFHQLFFPQGNWQFDNDSLMLKMLPGGIFFDGAIFIIVCWVVTVVAFITFGIILLVKNRRASLKEKVDLPPDLVVSNQ